nr:MAG TPA: hypothetical protein [Caudoviricetes sp.]
MIMFCYLFEFMYSCHTSMSHQYIKISYPCVLTDNYVKGRKIKCQVFIPTYRKPCCKIQ